MKALKRINIFSILVSLLNGASWTCIKRGHLTKTIVSDRLLHQKGDSQAMVDVFDGIYEECQRTGCNWSRGDMRKTGTITVEEMEYWMKSMDRKEEPKKHGI